MRTDVEVGCLWSILIGLIVIALIFVGSAIYDDGVCSERRKHIVTASDTVQFMRDGCHLPKIKK